MASIDLGIFSIAQIVSGRVLTKEQRPHFIILYFGSSSSPSSLLLPLKCSFCLLQTTVRYSRGPSWVKIIYAQYATSRAL